MKGCLLVTCDRLNHNSSGTTGHFLQGQARGRMPWTEECCQRYDVLASLSATTQTVTDTGFSLGQTKMFTYAFDRKSSDCDWYRFSHQGQSKRKDAFQCSPTAVEKDTVHWWLVTWSTIPHHAVMAVGTNHYLPKHNHQSGRDSDYQTSVLGTTFPCLDTGGATTTAKTWTMAVQ